MEVFFLGVKALKKIRLCKDVNNYFNVWFPSSGNNNVVDDEKFNRLPTHTCVQNLK